MGIDFAVPQQAGKRTYLGLAFLGAGGKLREFVYDAPKAPGIITLEEEPILYDVGAGEWLEVEPGSLGRRDVPSPGPAKEDYELTYAEAWRKGVDAAIGFLGTVHEGVGPRWFWEELSSLIVDACHVPKGWRVTRRTAPLVRWVREQENRFDGYGGIMDRQGRSVEVPERWRYLLPEVYLEVATVLGYVGRPVALVWVETLTLLQHGWEVLECAAGHWYLWGGNPARLWCPAHKDEYKRNAVLLRWWTGRRGDPDRGRRIKELKARLSALDAGRARLLEGEARQKAAVLLGIHAGPRTINEFLAKHPELLKYGGLRRFAGRQDRSVL